VVARCSGRVEMIVGAVYRVTIGGKYANWLAYAAGSVDLGPGVLSARMGYEFAP